MQALISPGTPRWSVRLEAFTTHRLQAGCDIGTVQELPGHSDVSTTMIDTHVPGRGGRGGRRPFDQIQALGTAMP